MGDADMAQVGKLLNGELLHIILVYVVQGGGDHQPSGGGQGQIGRVLLLLLDPPKFDAQRHQKSLHAGLVVGLAALHFTLYGSGQKINLRIIRLAHDMTEVMRGGKRNIQLRGRILEHILKQLAGIDEQIGPEASHTWGTVSGMGHMPWDTGNVSGAKRHGDSLKYHRPAVRMADPYLQAVVKVQMLAHFIGDAPAAAGEQQDRKIRRQIVLPVFDHGFFL